MSSVLPPLPMHDNIEPIEELKQVEKRDLSAVSPYLRGIDVPKNTRKPFTPLEREMWLNVVEVLLAKGVESTGQIAGITGLNATQVNFFQKDILKRWQSGVTPSTVNYRREKLYYEADRVKESCWRLFEKAEKENKDYKETVIYLKMIIDAGARQAKLCGLDNAEPTLIKQETTTQNINIPVGSLDKIGKLLAQELSEQKNDSQ